MAAKMLFPDEDAPELKKWIVKRLENNSDADADVLADYVMALLQHDGEVNAVRKLLEEEVPGFLKEGKDSTAFINDVFEAMEYRSYLPNAPPRPPKPQSQSQPQAQSREQKLQQKWQQQLQLMQQLNNGAGGGAQSQQQHAFGLSYDDGPMMAQQQQGQGRGYVLPPQSQAFSNGFGSGSKKRGYHDLDNPNAQQTGGGVFGGRSTKQARKGARDASQPGFAQQAEPSAGYYDPQIAASEFMRTLTQINAQMGLPPPDFSMLNSGGVGGGGGGGRGRGKKRARCRDFDKKGYCPRGINCNFQHSTDDLPPPPVSQQQAWDQNEEYDPANALMAGMFPPQYHPTSFQPTFEGNGFDTGGNAQQRQPRNQRNGGGRPHSKYTKRAPFSAEGASFDKSNTCIVVEQIPEENFDESQVRDFFSQFGNILEVSMQPYKRLAIVKYETWEEADAAYQSPKVIFENRFVRVYWHKEPSDDPSNGKKPAKNGFVKQEEGEEGEVPESEPIDLEEFTKKQEEAQRIHEEKQRKMEELERERRQVEQKQAELLEKAAKAKAELATKLARKSGTAGDDKNDTGEVSQTEILRAQLAMLEDEARGLGLDPDAPTEEDGTVPSSYYSPSTYDYTARGGGYRGRGRGRGRGGFVPRGRGGFHRGGYGGDVHAAYAAYSLDNRPRKVVMTGVDFTESGADEMLRQYLFGIGEFTDIQSTPNSTEIAFKDRKTAEKFYNLIALKGGSVPGVEGQVELAWASASGAPAPTTPRTNTQTAVKKEDQEEGEVDEDEDDHDHDHDDKDVRITLDRPAQTQAQQSRRVQDLDYEVADDDEGAWGY
ncbi:RNA-binding protein 26 [Cladorrhinum sp. PSN332]|nr:RNA-binding protein 26 [Cladorrhinum sp. PSN332]